MLYLVIFLLLLTILGLSKAEIIYEYNLDGREDRVVITFSLFWGLFKIRKDISKIKKRKKTETQDKILHFRQLYRLFDLTKKYLRRKIRIKNLNISIELGTGDACYTGLVTGLAWATVGSIISVITNIFDTEKFSCNIIPDFSKKTLKLDLDCIFSIRIVNIIVVGLKMLIFYLKNRKKFERTIGGDLSG